MKIDGYKCPNCGGTVKFDSSVQTMKCPFCDTEFELAALEEHQKEIEAIAKGDNFGWKVETEGDWDKSELDDLAAGNCPSCGAELFGNESTVSTVCPCCGNAQIIIKRLSGALKPDYVIPFKLEKKSAVDAMKDFCKGKRLLPSFFVEENHVQSMQGIYVPFWLFDANAHGHVRCKATKVRTWRSGDNNYVETSHYSVVRDGNLDFEKIPVDGSEKMDDNYMDAIEPFNYKEMKEFHQSFLAGYVAEKYDVDADKSKERAERRIKTTVEKEFVKTVTGYNSVRLESAVVDVKGGKVSYALFPVWVLNTKYDAKSYQFMMNGQTGRLVGKLPVDKGKAWKFRGMFTSIFGVFFTLLAFGLHAMGVIPEMIEINPSLSTLVVVSWVLAAASGFGMVYRWQVQMDTARLKTQAADYMVPGSLNIKIRKDTYLYKTVVKTGSPGKALVKAAGVAGVASRIGTRRR